MADSSIPALGEVVRASLAAGVERLRGHAPGVADDDGIEAVHQARVATRRLRSDLRTFRRALERGWARQVRRELRWLGDRLGDVRDADVLDQRLAGHAADAADADAAAFAALRQRLAAERAAAQRRAVAALGGDRYARLVLTLEAARSNPPLDGRARDATAAAVGRMVSKRWLDLRRTIEALGPEPSDRELHQVRIRVKRVRYAAEAAGPQAGPLAQAAAALQQVLGDHHDAVTAERWLRVAAASATSSEAFVAGQCVAAEREAQAEGRRRWRATWERLDRPELRDWMG